MEIAIYIYIHIYLSGMNLSGCVLRNSIGFSGRLGTPLVSPTAAGADAQGGRFAASWVGSSAPGPGRGTRPGGRGVCG